MKKQVEKLDAEIGNPEKKGQKAAKDLSLANWRFKPRPAAEIVRDSVSSIGSR